ncbi:M23 family metallopeptidase [Streptomyces sp. NPDC048506]|uniref:M23 family metallopeptidase n=1 Tax=Streptomyces sp. NPDC048506 TaxID=3155028 RepID=UPI0034158DEA
MTTFRSHTPLPRRLLRTLTSAAALAPAIALTASQAAATAPADSWTRPLHSWTHYRISAPYGVRGNWMAGHHTGIDFAVRTGTWVRSVGSGTVVLARRSGSYGNAVTIRMRDGHYTLFGHLSRITVRPGQKVHARTRIGYTGDTGRSTGPHLHFEVRAARSYGTDINPLSYLADHGVQLPLRTPDD